MSGIYNDTLITLLGCDSVITMNLTINNSSNDTLVASACDYYFWDGINYGGSGFYTNQYQNLNGCDSIVILDLTIYNSSTNIITINSCEFFEWDGVVYDSSGMYTNIYSNINSCDSTVMLDLTINNGSFDTISVVACDAYVWDNYAYNTSGSYTNEYADENGCDSIVTLNLTINNSSSSSIAVDACDSFEWDGVVFTSSGVYTNVYNNVNGCDSTVTLDLSLSYSTSSNQFMVVCDSVEWNGQVYNISGNYSFVTTNSVGCDSTANLILTVNYSNYIYDTVYVCNGDYYTVGMSIYSISGDYIDTVVSQNGCTSTIYTNLTVADSLIVSISETNLQLNANVSGGVSPYSYTWNTQQITSSITPASNGLYSLYVTDALGCQTDTAYYQFNVLPTLIDNQLISNLNLYPNPSNGVFTLEFDVNLLTDFNIRILNSIGEIIFEDQMTDNKGKYLKSYDISQYPKSIYFVEINTPVGVINKKLVVH